MMLPGCLNSFRSTSCVLYVAAAYLDNSPSLVTIARSYPDIRRYFM